MDSTSRRGFLGVAGAGAAALGVAALDPHVLTGAFHTSPRPPPLPADSTGAFVAYVQDATTGQVVIMTGEREVVVRDQDLAARIARAGASRTAV
jgi:hypothetical protein